MKKTNNQKVFLLTWLVVPFIGLWLSANYLWGLGQKLGRGLEASASAEIVRGNSLPGYRPEEVLQPYRWRGQGLVTFWFDDAWFSQYQKAFPILENKGWSGALAVATGFIGGEKYMTWPQVKKLHYRGWEVASHTRGHICETDSVKEEVLRLELRQGRDDLLAHDLPVDHFVTPCGAETPVILDQAKKLFLSLRTSEAGINELPVVDHYHIKANAIRYDTPLSQVQTLIEETEKTGGWLILMFHQIGEGSVEYGISDENFERMVEMVDESSLEVVLPSQAIGIYVRSG